MVEICDKMPNNSVHHQLHEAVLERDQLWRIHEKAQINFIQNQNAQMLGHLHAEIERLMAINRELNRKLNVSNSPVDDDKIKELEKRLEEEQQKNSELQTELSKNQRKTVILEKTLERTTAFYKDELSHHEDRIRQLTAELHDRTQTVTQLSTQLRSIKLREAMAQAQQRRRASCTSPKSPNSPITSPESNSAFRLFGFHSGKSSNPTTPSPKSSTMRPTTIRQPIWPDSIQTKENNIEKSRTNSTMNPTRPRHLISIRRSDSANSES
uniref:CCDC92/74 N-terminal domain-containing protein n=1 Tax=Panagrolaimus sp. JU765 TaxID=591449 RepID=A0AC34QV00_9BILA